MRCDAHGTVSSAEHIIKTAFSGFLSTLLVLWFSMREPVQLKVHPLVLRAVGVHGVNEKLCDVMLMVQ